jgi:hypothetical protein
MIADLHPVFEDRRRAGNAQDLVGIVVYAESTATCPTMTR